MTEAEFIREYLPVAIDGGFVVITRKGVYANVSSRAELMYYIQVLNHHVDVLQKQVSDMPSGSEETETKKEGNEICLPN